MSHRLTSLLATSLTCCGSTLWFVATAAVGYPLNHDGQPRPEPATVDAGHGNAAELGRSPTEPVPLASTNALKSTSSSVLRSGSRGQQVIAVQRLLADLDYDVAVDGRYGMQTQMAVMAFQRQAGLPVDGQVGALTLSKLQQVTDPTASPTDAPQFMAAATPIMATVPASVAPSTEPVASRTPASPSTAVPEVVSSATTPSEPTTVPAATSVATATEPSPAGNAPQPSNAESSANAAPSEAQPRSANMGLLGVIGLVMLAALGGLGWYAFQLRRPKSIKRLASSHRTPATQQRDDKKSPIERSPWDDEDEDDSIESPASRKTVEVSNDLSMQVVNPTSNSTSSTSSFLAPPSQSEVTRLARVDICEELIGDLHHSDAVKRRKAIWDLGQQGDSRAVQPLVDLLIDSDSHQRSLILAAISEIGIRTLKPINHALMYTLEDDNADVRKNAIRDVTRIYDMISQISQVLRHAADDTDEEVRDTARWALTQLNRIRNTPEIDPPSSLPGTNTIIPEALPDSSTPPQSNGML